MTRLPSTAAAAARAQRSPGLASFRVLVFQSSSAAITISALGNRWWIASATGFRLPPSYCGDRHVFGGLMDAGRRGEPLRDVDDVVAAGDGVIVALHGAAERKVLFSVGVDVLISVRVAVGVAQQHDQTVILNVQAVRLYPLLLQVRMLRRHRFGVLPNPTSVLGHAIAQGSGLRIVLLAGFLDLLGGSGVLVDGALSVLRPITPRLETVALLPIAEAAGRDRAVGKDDVTAVALAVAAAHVAAGKLAVGDDVLRRHQLMPSQCCIELRALVTYQGAHDTPSARTGSSRRGRR